MWRILCVVALACAACGGDDGRPLEEWVADFPDVAEGQVGCVAGELRAEEGEATLDEWTELDVAGWEEQDYLDHPEVSGALASAVFACT